MFPFFLLRDVYNFYTVFDAASSSLNILTHACEVGCECVSGTLQQELVLFLLLSRSHTQHTTLLSVSLSLSLFSPSFFSLSFFSLSL